jgi:hypothetical protein
MKAKPVRNMRSIILCCVVLLTTPLFARESTDVIVMKNGDRLTGEIKGLRSGVLYMSMNYILGTSSVQWSQVARLESKQLFLVKTEDGSVFTGELSTTDTASGRPMEIVVVESAEKEVLSSRRVVEMDTTSSKFFQRFNGNINTGTTYSKGNQSTQYNLSSAVNYPRERWAAQASYDSNLTGSTGVKASTRNQLDFDVYRLLRWDNWYYEGLGGFLQSSEQGIIHQTTFGGGIGRYLKNTNSAKISLIGGFVGQNTIYEENIVSQTLGSVLIGANLQFFRFNKTNGSVQAALTPVVSEPGRVKFNMNAAYYIKVKGNISWNVSFYGNWDNRPPTTLSGSDYGSSSGLSWTFGNK